LTKIFNMGAVHTWTGCLERLHDGNAVFRAGYGCDSLYLSEGTDWESDPLRMLHACFVPRSSEDVDSTVRLGLPKTGTWRRGARGILHRLRRRRTLDPRIKDYIRRGSSWKQEWYARDPVVSVDARPFLELAHVAERQPR